MLAAEVKKKENTHHSPPKGVGEIAKLFRIGFFFGQVHEERGKDERQKTDIYSCKQLLWRDDGEEICYDVIIIE